MSLEEVKSTTDDPKINYPVRITLCVMLVLLLEVFLGLYMYEMLKSNFQQQFLKELSNGLCRDEIRKILNNAEFTTKKRYGEFVEPWNSKLRDDAINTRLHDDFWAWSMDYNGVTPLEEIQTRITNEKSNPKLPLLNRKRRQTATIRLEDLQEFMKQVESWTMKGNSAGPPGVPGLQGPPGPQGPPGAPGLIGLVGGPGAKGVQGLPGFPGAKGDNGFSGPPGNRGEAGLPGFPGAKGDNGFSGPPGNRGQAGLPGFPGAKGDNGFSGPPGNKGEAGLPGFPGEKGDFGLPGVPGMPGFPGPKGEVGENGYHGITGVPGLPGVPGDKGDQGIPGLPGSKGEPGYPGLTGIPGLKGSKGDVGLTGLPGQCHCSGNTKSLIRKWEINKYGNTAYPGLPPRSAGCVMKTIRSPIFHAYNKGLKSCMVDSNPQTDIDIFKFFTTTNDNNTLFEYETNHLALNEPTKKHELYADFQGNAHAVYQGSFFYQAAQSKPLIIKYQLTNRTSQVLNVPGLTAQNSRPLYSTKRNFLHFNIDENGLWVIFAVPDSNNTGVMKVDAETMTVQDIFNITLDHSTYSEMFVISGILYALNDNKEENNAVDLYTHRTYYNNLDKFVELKPLMMYYDYKGKQLLVLEEDRERSYRLRCETNNLIENEVTAE